MKFEVGQIVVVNDIQFLKNYPGVFFLNKSFVGTRIGRHLANRIENINPIGIITWCGAYHDVWERKAEGPQHNLYTWLSQQDGIHYWFCEQDVVECSFL